MICRCKGVLVVLMRHTLMVMLGAGGDCFMLFIGWAMEWHQYRRQPLQGQGQQQHYRQQFANRFMHIYSAYQTFNQRAM